MLVISRIMTSRTVITISQREFLVRKFEEGMHSCGQNTLNARQAAARVSRRTPSDIKVRQVKGRVVHEQNKIDSN